MSYGTLRPLDEFARDFLGYVITESSLSDAVYVGTGIKLGPIFKENVGTLKVFSSTDRFWEMLMDATDDNKIAAGSPHEYTGNQPRENRDGFLVSPILTERVTRKHFWIPPEDREGWLQSLFSGEVAHKLASYGAIILLHKPERWAKEYTRERNMPWARTQKEFEEAKAQAIEVASHRVCAHECLHLVQLVVGTEMPEWDPATSADPVEEYFQNFVRRTTAPVFEKLYVSRNNRQVDEIDL